VAPLKCIHYGTGSQWKFDRNLDVEPERGKRVIVLARALVLCDDSWRILGDPKSEPECLIVTAITYLQPPLVIFWHIYSIHYTKFASGEYIVSAPNAVCVTTLPCKIVVTNLFMFTCINYTSERE